MRTVSLPRWVASSVPAALALALTLFELGTRSLWLDEGASVAIASQHGSALWNAIVHDGGNMLAYYLGLHVLIASGGDALSLLRLPSAAFAAAAVALVADMALRAWGRRAALYAGVLGAVSLPMVYWGQDIRGYAPMMMLVTASFWSLARLMSDESRRWPGATYVLSAALAVMCAIPAALVLPTQALAILAGPRWARRRGLFALAAASSACVPVLVLAIRRGSGQLFWVASPTWSDVGQALRWLTSAGMPPNFHATWAAVPVLLLSLALLVAMVTLVMLEKEGSAARSLAWLVVGWILVPLVLNVAESLLGQPVFLPRNSLVSLPAVSLAIAWLLAHRRLPVPVGCAVLALILGLRVAVLVPSYGTEPEDWRAATSYVLQRTTPGDCVAFYPQDARMPFAIYVRARSAQRSAPRPVLPELGWGVVRPFVESYRAPQLTGRLASCHRLWLIASHMGRADGPPVSAANFTRLQRLKSCLAQGYRIVGGRSFSYADPIEVTLLQRSSGGRAASRGQGRRAAPL